MVANKPTENSLLSEFYRFFKYTVLTLADNLRIVCAGWAVSSAVEHCFHTAGVTGSNPVPPTIPT